MGLILKGEDTPATIPTIISLLNECNNTTPLLTKNYGILATLYGMTKLSLEEIQKIGLYDLISSWKDTELPMGATEDEHKIDILPFDSNE